MIEKVLIANRGEIALRILRACREMGIQAVAIHSTADVDAMHVRLADESVCVGPPAADQSYLNIPAILTAATISNADAIHPGYGFLSENSNFAKMAEEHGFTFIGPSSKHIKLMGDKIKAKEAVMNAGIPVVPGSDGRVENIEAAMSIGQKIGFPLIIKASAGGGGRGMKVAKNQESLTKAFNLASGEALAFFGNPSVYIEKFLQNPRHIEVQIIADNQGNVIHLGERDCSIQRRHQKLIEEAPSTALSKSQRQKIGSIVTKAIKKIGYRSVGTIEFLFEDDKFYFIEMNTRLQVEHPVTEMICGIDLVREMIRVAGGAPISFTQEEVLFSGHSMECRINAEDPTSFFPSPGTITEYHAPGGLGVRVDSGLYNGYKVPSHYDSMISKLIVHGANREQCLMRLRRALSEYVIDGIKTSIPLHQRILEEPDFISGDYSIHWLENLVSKNQK